MNQTKDIGNLCTDCHRDTSFGSGLFVNRIPSGTETEVGYLCPECQQHECDRCNELIGCDEDIYLEETFERVHEECAREKELVELRRLKEEEDYESAKFWGEVEEDQS
jgi:hypothetical protein|tara:strand:- start:595 stop:918 length:324 start_codon:yes stop_codon:yes gene_type:complete